LIVLIGNWLQLAGDDALVRQTVCWLPVVPTPARREPAAEFPAASGNQQTQQL
jgi:hypothetical protein